MFPFGNRKGMQLSCCGIRKKTTKVKEYSELEKMYQVDYNRLLGKGASSYVYPGIEIATGRRVAVKRISRKFQSSSKLKVEVESLLRVKGHPNIVALYDVFVATDVVVLTMELMEGGELYSRIMGSGAYSEQDASIHFHKIAHALAHLHNNGIVHRDLKPENLVLASRDANSEIKISDFGLSKILDDGNLLMETFCGTPAYLAPEMWATKGYNAKVDTWSYGVILYVALAAYHPFAPSGEADRASLQRNVCSYNWNFDHPIWQNISENAKDLIRKLLCPQEQRLSANEILEHPWITSSGSGAIPNVPLQRPPFPGIDADEHESDDQVSDSGDEEMHDDEDEKEEIIEDLAMPFDEDGTSDYPQKRHEPIVEVDTPTTIPFYDQSEHRNPDMHHEQHNNADEYATNGLYVPDDSENFNRYSSHELDNSHGRLHGFPTHGDSRSTIPIDPSISTLPMHSSSDTQMKMRTDSSMQLGIN